MSASLCSDSRRMPLAFPRCVPQLSVFPTVSTTAKTLCSRSADNICWHARSMHSIASEAVSISPCEHKN